MTAPKDAMESAKKEIKRLIDKYEDLKKSGGITSFNEDNTCTKFILPLFHALGWDTEGKEIIDEVTGQKQAGGQKRVDYSFNVSGQPIMFLEAKQLSADLDNPQYARQAINYGYSKTVKWVVLSDFEGIIVFNALLKLKKERISERTVLKLKYTEYLDKIDELWLLSKQSFFNDALNKHAISKGHKINKIPINELLLLKLLVWRNDLIKKITSDNDNLSKEDIAECVQRLLNRLIFIRTCEDRKIDQLNLLKNLIKEWQTSNKRLDKMLQDVFRDFNEGYDSSLFEKHLVDAIKIDSDLLFAIIGGLYEDIDEDVEFDFAIIDADMLGSIYEQYLGTIQKGEGAKDKEKRKRQGIYYTPKYIVDYIVKNTLGKVLAELLKNKEYDKISKLKILDPACGSGSFLLKALEELNDTYEKVPEAIKLAEGGKIRALRNNIYGVDLDAEAVELTKLNLLLSSINLKERLPNLNHNIECGNSLIDDPNVAGDKAFDWNKRFKDVMDRGGFDVVIGNPPYVRAENMNKSERDFFMNPNNFPNVFGRFDVYILFIEKAISLLSSGGRMSFIIPFSFLSQNYAKLLRKYILDTCLIESIVDFSAVKVFKEAMVANCIIVLRKEASQISRNNNNINIIKSNNQNILSKDNSYQICQKLFIDTPHYMYRIEFRPEIINIIKHLDKNSIKMQELCYVVIGAVPHGKGGRSKNELIYDEAKKPTCKPYIEGKNVSRYISKWEHKYLSYEPQIMHRPKFPELFENEKLFVRNISGRDGLMAAYDKRSLYANDTLSICVKWDKLENIDYVKNEIPKVKNEYNKYNIMFLLGIINSKMANFYFNNVLGGGLHVYPESIRQIPVHKINFNNTKEKKIHDDIVKLADKMIDLNQQYAKVKDKQTSETERLRRQIEETDREIDQLIYKLYGLTEEEIGVVEGAR